MKNKVFQSIAILFVLLFTSRMSAQTNEFGFSVGLLTGGNVYVAELDQDFDLESGISLFGFYDFFITEKFAIGPNVSFSFPSLALLEDSVNFYEFAFAIKPKFELSDTVSYKPGFNLGYRIITAADVDDIGGNIQGLGLNITNELQFKVSDSLTPFIDIGFISQTAGGNEEFNVTFGPIIVLRAGLVFR